MDHTESIELERKYEVDVDAELPRDFSAAGLQADPPQRFRLEAQYFDTAGGHLARQRVAVRMRLGGKDEGWHLKCKVAEGARELLWPPSQEMPRGLREEIARLTDRPVLPLAELHTRRTVLHLRDADGVEVVEVSDDRVLSEHHATGVRRAWREWEAELIPGADLALLDAVEPVLLLAGADPSPSPAKIARATGLVRGMADADRAAARRLDL